jgi:hypothetical protein
MAPFLDGSGVVVGEVVDGPFGEVGEEEGLSFPPPQALNRRAVAALRANASVVFFGESILSPDSDLMGSGFKFLEVNDLYVCLLLIE